MFEVLISKKIVNASRFIFSFQTRIPIFKIYRQGGLRQHTGVTLITSVCKKKFAMTYFDNLKKNITLYSNENLYCSSFTKLDRKLNVCD
ncbi:hypothetical protein DDV96_07470 [Marixanthomonas spongiae]|uniref:Uncharacterized protein n=1 Tax=Marixanthomonas spongiae TaxID=2174845 RepID=A0A2U0I2A2_9FLAO|nr:hypothetical protein DDV96_07470 [Marixanthomonas spongiae]